MDSSTVRSGLGYDRRVQMANEGHRMTIPKMQEKFRRDNLDSARRIMSDPKYQEGSLLKIWARSYLAKAAAEAGKRANDRH